MRIDSRTIESLEYPTIISAICGGSLTPYGAERSSALRPLTDIKKIRRSLREAAQLRDLLQFDDPFPLGRVEEIRPALDKSSLEGARLEPEDFLEIRETLSLFSKLKAYKKDSRENFPDLAEHLDTLGVFSELKDAINRVISKDGEIKDNASSELRKIRSTIADTRRKIISKLESTIASRKKVAGWQDDVVTQRNGRYVIPVQASAHRSSDGIVVDHSHSGATLFVEPPYAVELNNKLTMAQQEERREIDRILTQLTAILHEHAFSLRESITELGIIDSLHAIANFAIKTSGIAPEICAEAEVELIEARHPLLLYYTEDKTTVIPLDLSLGKLRQGLLITGPNTGGKTVALKTVGLLTLMAQSGILIPANERSRIGMFSQIYADIGDEQSIELSLSTFSSHITKVIRALKRADEFSLLLFDEIGAGTDPAEGAALAEAILLEALDKGARLIVTTHYSQLKTLPLTYPELENASLEFDRESLRPTYRVRIGSPGSSYAIEIAQRLGMPERVIQRASETLGEQERSLADLITSMESELAQVRADSARLSEKASSAEKLEKLYSEKLAALEKETGAQKDEARREAEQIVAETRAEMERIVKQIRETQAESDAVKAAHQTLRNAQSSLQTRRNTRNSINHTASAPDELAPGDFVWINSLRVDGEVAELVGDDRLRVRVGNMLNLVKRSDVTKANLPAGAKRPRRDPVGMREETAPAREIHLRGLTVEEATDKLDKFLDQAVLSDLSQVYVIHGKGSGTLRKALTDFLKAHPAVKSVRLGDWNQGGAGVTIAQLK